MSDKKKWPETLGSTPDEIAETLRGQGVRGIPGDCDNCIVARSYKATYPDGWSGLKVGYTKGHPHTASMSFHDIQICDPHMSSEFAKTLGEFMHKFDYGEYSFLVAKQIPSKKSVLAKMTTEERIAIGE